METNYSIPLVAVSYAVSVVGSFMALLVYRDALKRAAGERGGLVALAALCLGGVVIWSMHFIGMMAASFLPEPNMPPMPPTQTGASTLVLSIITIDFLVALLASTVAMVEANKRTAL